MSNKGRMKYVPSIIIEEVQDIKREDDIEKDVEAMLKLCKYARVGREVNRLRKLNWSKFKSLPPIEIISKKKRGSLF